MKKIIFVFISLLIISIEAIPAAVTTYYNNWKIRRISYNNTDNRTVTMTIKKNNDLEVYIAARYNQINISINWFKDKIDDSTPIVQYSFNNSAYKSAEPFMRSASDNFDILYTISPDFGIIQEKEMVDFFKNLINCKTLSIRPGNSSEGYTIDVTGIKEAILKTDFSGTLFEKYKSQIVK